MFAALKGNSPDFSLNSSRQFSNNRLVCREFRGDFFTTLSNDQSDVPLGSGRQANERVLRVEMSHIHRKSPSTSFSFVFPPSSTSPPPSLAFQWANIPFMLGINVAARYMKADDGSGPDCGGQSRATNDNNHRGTTTTLRHHAEWEPRDESAKSFHLIIFFNSIFSRSFLIKFVYVCLHSVLPLRALRMVPTSSSLARVFHGHELKFSSTFFFALVLVSCIRLFERLTNYAWKKLYFFIARCRSELHPYWLGRNVLFLARALKSVTMQKLRENSSSRSQLGWGDDTMNDDDLCSCNFKNKFYHPQSPFSSARYFFTRYLSWRWWCVVSLRVRCRVYMQSRDEEGRRKDDDDDNKIVGIAQKSLSTACDVVVVATAAVSVVFLHFPYHDRVKVWVVKKNKPRTWRWNEEWANLCDVTHSDDEFSRVSRWLCVNNLFKKFHNLPWI